MRRVVTIVAVTALVVLAGCAGGGTDVSNGQPMGDGADGGMADGGSGDSVGVAVGGAQDANAFHRNVQNGYVPQPTDLSHEGLFHDYYFDTGSNGTCEARFCPSYTTAVTRDPLSNETERFVSVGLNTGLTREDVQRDPVNLVIVLDTSGSMDAPFDEYHQGSGDGSEGEQARPKLAVARDTVVSMTDRLGPDDRVGVVTFDEQASVLQDLSRVNDTDMADLRADLGALRAGGGTNMDAGMRRGRQLLSDVATRERTTRIVYVTDAQPNAGDTNGESLGERVQEYADAGIHTTVVGVGVDFNSEFTDHVATTEGANYYSVHSPTAFENRMDEAFSYMVTPLAYNLTLRAVGDGADIEHVYGTPRPDASDGELVSVSTLFPARREDNRTEGGVVLLEVDGAADAQVRLVATYEDPSRERHRVVRNVTFDREAPYYGSTGVRKAVALTEYANLLRNWMAHERGAVEVPGEHASIEHRTYADSWEQQPVELTVTAPYDERIAAFVPYFRAHVDALGAARMRQDLRILHRLANETAPANTAIPGETVGEDAPTVADAGTATGAGDEASAGLPSLGGVGPLVGLANLLVTVAVAAYGVGQKRRSRNRDGEGDW